MGYAVDTKTLRDAAKAVDSAVEQVSSVKLSTALADSGTGMPGSRSVASMAAVEKAWEQQIKGWVRQADRYARGLRATADNYDRTEAANAHGFEALPKTS